MAQLSGLDQSKAVAVAGSASLVPMGDRPSVRTGPALAVQPLCTGCSLHAVQWTARPGAAALASYQLLYLL